MPVRFLAAVAVLLVAAPAAAVELPPMPAPDEGWLALLGWLRAVNAQLSIPDAEFRLMFGGFSLPVLLFFEIVGIRSDWKLYPFLIPFWLLFGGVGLGAVAGVALTAAHLVLFPAGRLAFVLRQRRRAGEGAPRTEPARVEPARPPARPALQGGLKALLEVVRAAAEQARQAAERAAAEKRGGAAPSRPPWSEPPAPAPAPPRPAPPRPTSPRADAPAPPPPQPGHPDVGRFRPDLSRFRRPPPKQR
jgi:hypothetical protein